MLSDSVAVLNLIRNHLGDSSNFLMVHDDVDFKKTMSSLSFSKSLSMSELAAELSRTQLCMYTFVVNGKNWKPFVSKENFNDLRVIKADVVAKFDDADMKLKRFEFIAAVERFLRLNRMALVA